MNSHRSSKRRRNRMSRVSRLSLMSGNRSAASSRISLFVNAILPVPTNAASSFQSSRSGIPLIRYASSMKMLSSDLYRASLRECSFAS
jgi:hypothetical protein